MAQVVRSRVSRLAMQAGTAIGAAGLAVVALTCVGAPEATALTVPHAYVANNGGHMVSVIPPPTQW